MRTPAAHAPRSRLQDGKPDLAGRGSAVELDAALSPAVQAGGESQQCRLGVESEYMDAGVMGKLVLQQDGDVSSLMISRISLRRLVWRQNLDPLSCSADR
jgi:hypothetical protein